MEEYALTNLQAVLAQYAEAVRNEYQDELIRQGKIATGDLLNSCEFEVVSESGLAYSVVLTLKDYWRWVEYGRKAGGKLPPIDAIKNWISAKPVIPKPDARGKLPTAEQLSFLIARKIARDGIPPTNALAKSVRLKNEDWNEKIADALLTDMGKAVDVKIQAFFEK